MGVADSVRMRTRASARARTEQVHGDVQILASL